MQKEEMAGQEAIALYRKLGYEQMENFGVYAGNANSICMKKELYG